MAFDRTNPADLLTLKTEVLTDPLGMGYNLNGSADRILFKLNDPDSNLGGETTADDLTVELLMDAIVPDDLTVGGQFSQGDLEWLKLLIESSATLQDVIEKWRVKVVALFPGNSTTAANLNAQVRKLSRAEVLFGVDTRIVIEDWIAARDS